VYGKTVVDASADDPGQCRQEHDDVYHAALDVPGEAHGSDEEADSCCATVLFLSSSLSQAFSSLDSLAVFSCEY
jgi:hypothetical protein